MKNLGLAILAYSALIFMAAGFGLMFGGFLGVIILVPLAMIMGLPLIGIILYFGKEKKE
jgi:hypothetical protein